MDEPLPFVDSHSIDVPVACEAAWAGLIETMRPDPLRVVPTRAARVLGVRDVTASGEFPASGSTLRGFQVEACDPPARLLLAGRHRFSAYALEFRVEELGASRSRVTAETRAAFPGLAGVAYRALVIGTRGHVVVVKRMLSRIRAAAIRSAET